MVKKNVFIFLVISIALAALNGGCTTTKNAGVAIQEGSIEAGQQVGNKAELAGEKVEDASITAAVKMKFANDELVSASDINVDTTNGHVTLNGKVSSRAEATRAIEIGRSVDGVKSVYSRLTFSEELTK